MGHTVPGDLTTPRHGPNTILSIYTATSSLAWLCLCQEQLACIDLQIMGSTAVFTGATWHFSFQAWNNQGSSFQGPSPWPIPTPGDPGSASSQGYFLGGNWWRRRDRWARPACGRAKGGGGDCQRQCEVGPAPEGQNCRSGGRVMRRTEAAGVWRERWRSAMQVPRRGRG